MITINMYSPLMDYQNHRSEYQMAINEVLESGCFINGPHIKQLEKQLCLFTGADYCIATSSGTDALLVALMSLNLKPNDEVITVGLTWISSAEVISLLGLIVKFVDVDPESYLMDLDKLESMITEKTKCIIYVSLYGQFKDPIKLMNIAKNNNLWVIEDAAQSFGSYIIHDNTIINSCNWAHISTTSFFPSKPLGAYGDAGACFTNSKYLSDKMKAITNHGGLERFKHTYIGLNARMDTIQASILLVKLKYLNNALQRRREIAKMYNDGLANLKELILPKIYINSHSSWAQYTISIIEDTFTRDQLITKLKNEGINTSIFYPIGIHQQKCFTDLYGNTQLPVTEKLCKYILNLPLYPELTNQQINYIINTIINFYH